MQQPDSNSSRSQRGGGSGGGGGGGVGWRLSGGLDRMIGDPVGGSGDGGSPISWVVAETGEKRE